MNIHGHRGARGLFPENTIHGFIEAVKIGVDTLELDVVISKDQQVVVSHEPWMNPEICLLPDGSAIAGNDLNQYNLYRMNYDEIKQYDCGMRSHARFLKQQKLAACKPLLADMIDAVEQFIQQNQLRSVEYNIETKCTPEGDDIFHPGPQTFAQLLYDVLLKKKINHRCYIQSFDLRTLQYLHQIKADVKLVLLVDNDFDFEHNINRLGFMPGVYSPKQELVNEKLVQQCKAANLLLIPWTVNDVEVMIKFKYAGVDGLITDYPDVAVKLLRTT